MPTVVGTDLFDHTIDASYYTDGFAGSPAQDLSIVRSGDPASLLISTTSATEYIQINFTGTQMPWVGFAFRIESAPSTALTVMDLQGVSSGNSRAYVDENTRIDVWTAPVSNYPYAQITTGAWYWIEMIPDFSGTTFHTYWRWNLTGETATDGTVSDSNSGQTANNIASLRIGISTADTITYRVSHLMWGTAATTADFLGEPLGQVAAPTADSVDGSWTDQSGGTSLYAAIDETSYSDSDYIRSELGPSNSGCRVKLASLTDPGSSTGHIIHWRPGKDTTGGATINMTVKLYQGGGNSIGGGTLIKSASRNNVDAFTSYEETLSGSEADSITDYTDLYLEFFANTA